MKNNLDRDINLFEFFQLIHAYHYGDDVQLFHLQ